MQGPAEESAERETASSGNSVRGSNVVLQQWGAGLVWSLGAGREKKQSTDHYKGPTLRPVTGPTFTRDCQIPALRAGSASKNVALSCANHGGHAIRGTPHSGTAGAKGCLHCLCALGTLRGTASDATFPTSGLTCKLLPASWVSKKCSKVLLQCVMSSYLLPSCCRDRHIWPQELYCSIRVSCRDTVREAVHGENRFQTVNLQRRLNHFTVQRTRML